MGGNSNNSNNMGMGGNSNNSNNMGMGGNSNNGNGNNMGMGGNSNNGNGNNMGMGMGGDNNGGMGMRNFGFFRVFIPKIPVTFNAFNGNVLGRMNMNSNGTKRRLGRSSKEDLFVKKFVPSSGTPKEG